MKKLLTLLLSLTLVISMLTGCGAKKTDDTTTDVAPTQAPADETADPTEAPATDDTATDDTAAPAEAAKTGLAVITSLGKSKDAAADAEGLAQIDSVVAAVLVGPDGKILDCSIDAAQTKVNFSLEGKLTTDVASTFKSKQELGTEYGMLAASGISKEWNEQADAFAAYVVGKTVDEVKGIALTEEGVASDADLAASVTIHLADYIAVVEKAVTNAQDFGAKVGDKIGLGLATDIAKSKDAAADADGLAQAYSYYTALTTGADGKITSCFIDASQGNVNFTTAGVITTDLTVAPQTKQELKEGYGMKAASGIGKEWYEQANAFATFATGKTLDEVKGMSITEDGKAGDADLASSVTVHITSFVSTIEKAVANAAK
ncbi:MAG: hypothetical protein K0S47_2983 [Herbinix sp.]|jgi:hypothetical protein|nr:hypothetical protein [Herbinix sp.]